MNNYELLQGHKNSYIYLYERVEKGVYRELEIHNDNIGKEFFYYDRKHKEYNNRVIIPAEHIKDFVNNLFQQKQIDNSDMIIRINWGSYENI